VKDKMSPEHWRLLMDKTSGLLTPESSLEKMKPWALTVLLTQKMLPEQGDPMDKILYEKAKADGDKKLEFLETAEEQCEIADKSLDIASLEDTLADLPKAEKNLTGLADAYKAGDIPLMTKVVFDPEDMKKHPKMFDDLLWARNKRWIPKLMPMLDAGSVFVAVGAAHYLGDNGLVKLLEDKGYTVTRVTPDKAP
jgi:uncharacterized protein YbaP (TraB family)